MTILSFFLIYPQAYGEKLKNSLFLVSEPAPNTASAGALPGPADAFEPRDVNNTILL
jgi:hypothetical protein